MMKFAKYVGIGNDFIICEEKLKNLNVIELCDRHKGIGADGVILIDSTEEDIIDITIFNADGSIASTCGNGLRCVGAYLHNKNNKKEFKIRTISSTYNVKCLGNNEYEVEFPIVREINKENEYYVVSSGNLHVFTINKVDFDDFVNEVRNYYDANVERIEILNKDCIKIRVNERGVGETLACGSACIAVVSALYKDNLVNDQVECIMNGGTLKVKIHENSASLIGKANFIFKGEI